MRAVIFTVFEHNALQIEQTYNGIEFTRAHFELLEKFYREENFPYYTIIRKGIRFCEYVGVIQVGNILIEVLPKADKTLLSLGNKEITEEAIWRKMLIDMLRAVGAFNIHAPSSSDLKLKSNSILDLYFELFITECEQLLHKGLLKKYRKIEGNLHTLKGGLIFSKHIQQNLTHQERFYVRSTTYDNQNALNCILYKTINMLNCMNTNQALSSRIGFLLINFPELPDIKVNDQLFSRIQYNRKNEPYKQAMQIAKLLLLNYHPDVQAGKHDVLALMFDMNVLWEEFVYKSIKSNNEDYIVTAQSPRNFWQKENAYPVKMKPDIIIKREDGNVVVLDTKWKNIGDSNPSPEDLRQMYTYSKFHNNAITALVYPGNENRPVKGFFLNEHENEQQDKLCSIVKLNVNRDIKVWQKEIANALLRLCADS